MVYKALTIHLEEHLIGLDGIGILVNGSNPIISLDLNALRKIYTCEVTQWSQLPGQPSDSFIRVLRRDNESGTTDTFKNLVGIKEFGPCVQVVASADEILRQVTGDANAIGYAGASGSPIGSKHLAIAQDTASQAYQPTVEAIQHGTYPLARKLFVYENSSLDQNSPERQLLSMMLERTFMDPILIASGFFTID